MNKLKESAQVSLAEICDEKRVRMDPSLGKKVTGTVYFSSMRALIHGAFEFVEFFERLHKDGKVYCGSSPEPFRFSLASGHMSVSPDIFVKEETDSVAEVTDDGITEFLAPELVEELAAHPESAEVSFTIETDWYFMAVFLFEYFFHTGSPFEGKKMVNRCFLSPLEKEMFRVEQGQFCMDIGENENTPVKGIQDKLIRYWSEYPQILKKMFQRAFLDRGSLCELRPTEVDWKQLLVRMTMDYKTCGCGFRGFSYRLVPQENGTLACPKCGKIYYALTNTMDRILLADGEKLYECQTGRDPFNKDDVTGLVVENRQRKGLYGIKNISRGTWKGLYPDKTVREIPPGQGIPIWNGMMIRFEAGEEWNLRLVHPIDESEVDENEQ